MKTVIEMAREAKLSPVDFPTTEQLERFAELVRADEREACAKLADDESMSRREIAAAIRARGLK